MLKIEPKWNMYCFLETWEHTLKWLDKRMIHMPQQTIIIWPISILHCIQRLYTGNGLTDFIHLRPWKFLVVIRHCVRLPLLILLVSSAYTGQQSRRGQTKTPLPSGDSTSILLCRRQEKQVQAKTAYDAAAFFWKGKIVKIILKLLSSAQFRPSTIKIVNLVPELYKWVRFCPYAELACHGGLSHQRRVSLGLHPLVKYPFYL